MNSKGTIGSGGQIIIVPHEGIATSTITMGIPTSLRQSNEWLSVPVEHKVILTFYRQPRFGHRACLETRTGSGGIDE